ncbi:MAG TPA: hypothetical protein VF521_04420, partial [Pyrinomonadaceae bacterium]
TYGSGSFLSSLRPPDNRFDPPAASLSTNMCRPARVASRAGRRVVRGVMLSCDTDNIASAKVIERNGGRLEGHATSERSGRQISRYRIEL